MEVKSEVSDGSLLLLVAFLLVNAPNCHLSLVLASVVQGDAVNCNSCQFDTQIFEINICTICLHIMSSLIIKVFVKVKTLILFMLLSEQARGSPTWSVWATRCLQAPCW